MYYTSDIKREFEKMIENWTRKNIELPVELYNDSRLPIFDCINDSLLSLHKNHQLLLPNFDDTESVLILSDYGGEAHTSKYLTYTFTFVDYNATGFFSRAMSEIREKHGLFDPHKEIAYKDIKRYRQLSRCLPEYLSLTNNFLNGLIFTLVVDKRVVSLSGDNNRKSNEELASLMSNNGLGRWTPDTAEKLHRIIQVGSYFCNLLIGAGKKILWMTDNDSIMANEEKADAASQMIVNLLNSFKKAKKYDVVAITPKPFDKHEDKLLMGDLLSLSDLVAGSIEHYFTNDKNVNSNKKSETVMILQWLAGQGVGLKKRTLSIRLDKTGLVGSSVDFIADNPMLEVNQADYRYDVKIHKG
jgi:hypothetical protein